MTGRKECSCLSNDHSVFFCRHQPSSNATAPGYFDRFPLPYWERCCSAFRRRSCFRASKSNSSNKDSTKNCTCLKDSLHYVNGQVLHSGESTQSISEANIRTVSDILMNSDHDLQHLLKSHTSDQFENVIYTPDGSGFFCSGLKPGSERFHIFSWLPCITLRIPSWTLQKKGNSLGFISIPYPWKIVLNQIFHTASSHYYASRRPCRVILNFSQMLSTLRPGSSIHFRTVPCAPCRSG